MYKIDSCLEKIKQKRHDICNQPSFHTVCNKPILKRDILTRNDHLRILSTPKGFIWTGINSYYKKFTENNTHKLKALDQQKRSKFQKSHKQGDINSYINRPKSWNNTYQNKIEQVIENKENRVNKQNEIIKRNQQYNRKLRLFNGNNLTTNYFNPINTNNEKKSNIQNKIIDGNLKNKHENTKIQKEFNNENDTLILHEENDSIEKLKNIQKQERNDLLKRKKQLWLLAEKKRKKREEKEKKFKSSMQAKQKAYEELKKKMEKNIKLKAKRKQIIEENERKNNIKNEQMGESSKKVEKHILEEQVKERKDVEKNLRLKILELEAQRIIKEEESWRSKIIQEFALKMDYSTNSKNHDLLIIPNIVNNKSENSIGKIGKKRFIECTKNLLQEIKQNDQVFDSGNVMKQIVNNELYMIKNRQVKLKKKKKVNCDLFNSTINTQIIEIEDKNDNKHKSVVFKKQGNFNIMTDSTNLYNKVRVESYEHCVSNKQHVLTYKSPMVQHCYSNISLNTIVCHWKNEVADMKINMRKRRFNFIQNTFAKNM